MRPPRWMLLSREQDFLDDAKRLPAPPDGFRRLVFALVPEMGGAWTEVRGDLETIRFGYPADAKSVWFRVEDPPPAPRHNVASLALERILFARKVELLLVGDSCLESLARRGAAVHAGVRLLVRGPGESGGEFLQRLQEEIPAP